MERAIADGILPTVAAVAHPSVLGRHLQLWDRVFNLRSMWGGRNPRWEVWMFIPVGGGAMPPLQTYWTCTRHSGCIVTWGYWPPVIGPASGSNTQDKCLLSSGGQILISKTILKSWRQSTGVKKTYQRSKLAVVALRGCGSNAWNISWVTPQREMVWWGLRQGRPS